MTGSATYTVRTQENLTKLLNSTHDQNQTDFHCTHGKRGGGGGGGLLPTCAGLMWRTAQRDGESYQSFQDLLLFPINVQINIQPFCALVNYNCPQRSASLSDILK